MRPDFFFVGQYDYKFPNHLKLYLYLYCFEYILSEDTFSDL